MAPALLFGLGLVLVVAVGVGAWFASKKRTEALQAWAVQHGWTYVGTDRSLVKRWSGSPFGQGDSRRASEVLTGPAGGRQAISFRYTYSTGSSGENDTRTTYEHHVVAVFLPVPLPLLDVVPETFGAKIAKAFGGQDIQFELEDFNRRWRVVSRDLKFAHDVVHPRAIDRLMQPDVARTRFRFVGDALLTWTSGRPDVTTVMATAARLNEVIDLIPDYVWQDRGYYAR